MADYKLYEQQIKELEENKLNQIERLNRNYRFFHWKHLLIATGLLFIFVFCYFQSYQYDGIGTGLNWYEFFSSFLIGIIISTGCIFFATEKYNYLTKLPDLEKEDHKQIEDILLQLSENQKVYEKNVRRYMRNLLLAMMFSVIVVQIINYAIFNGPTNLFIILLVGLWLIAIHSVGLSIKHVKLFLLHRKQKQEVPLIFKEWGNALLKGEGE